MKSATFIKIYLEMYLSCFYMFVFDTNNHMEQFPTKPEEIVGIWWFCQMRQNQVF